MRAQHDMENSTRTIRINGSGSILDKCIFYLVLGMVLGQVSVLATMHLLKRAQWQQLKRAEELSWRDGTGNNSRWVNSDARYMYEGVRNAK